MSTKLNLFGATIAVNPATNDSTDWGTAGITSDGGFYITMIAAENLVRGNVVYQSQSGTADRASKAPSDSDMPIGVVYQDVSMGSVAIIVFAGIAWVKPRSDVNLARGYVIYVAGGGATGEVEQATTVPVIATHMREVGHVLLGGAGNGVINKCIVHFN